MGTFVTNPSETLFDDKEQAPGLSLRSGWTENNVTRAEDLNALRDAAYDLRTYARAITQGGVNVATIAAGTTTARNNSDRFGEVFRPEDFGAVGDGTTDDTVAIQAAIGAAQNNGGIVEFLNKVYVCGAVSIDGRYGIWLRGQGMAGDRGAGAAGLGGTVIKHLGTGSLITIGDSTDDNRAGRIQITDIRFAGNGGVSEGRAIRFVKVHNCVVYRCRFWGWGGSIVVELYYAWANNFIECHFNHNTNATAIYAGVYNAFQLVQRCNFHSNAKGVWFEGDVDGSKIINNDFSGQSVVGCQLDCTAPVHSAAVTVAWNYAEGQIGHNYLFGTTGGTGFLYNLQFFGNLINAGTGGTAADHKVEFNRCRNFLISGNYFIQSGVVVGSDSSNGHFDVTNYLHTDSTISISNGSVKFDQVSDAQATKFGGLSPRHDFRATGWDNVSRVGLATYSADVAEFQQNVKAISATQGNLDDIAAPGSLIRQAGGFFEVFCVQQGGANPRTLSRSFISSTLGGQESSGIATLVGGTVTVSTWCARTGSIILVTRATPGGTVGDLSVPPASIVNNDHFVINSTSGTDTSTVFWMIVR